MLNISGVATRCGWVSGGYHLHKQDTYYSNIVFEWPHVCKNQFPTLYYGSFDNKSLMNIQILLSCYFLNIRIKHPDIQINLRGLLHVGSPIN